MSCVIVMSSVFVIGSMDSLETMEMIRAKLQLIPLNCYLSTDAINRKLILEQSDVVVVLFSCCPAVLIDLGISIGMGKRIFLYDVFSECCVGEECNIRSFPSINGICAELFRLFA